MYMSVKVRVEGALAKVWPARGGRNIMAGQGGAKPEVWPKSSVLKTCSERVTKQGNGRPGGAARPKVWQRCSVLNICSKRITMADEEPARGGAVYSSPGGADKPQVGYLLARFNITKIEPLVVNDFREKKCQKRYQAAPTVSLGPPRKSWEFGGYCISLQHEEL